MKKSAAELTAARRAVPVAGARSSATPQQARAQGQYSPKNYKADMKRLEAQAEAQAQAMRLQAMPAQSGFGFTRTGHSLAHKKLQEVRGRTVMVRASHQCKDGGDVLNGERYTIRDKCSRGSGWELTDGQRVVRWVPSAALELVPV